MKRTIIRVLLGSLLLANGSCLSVSSFQPPISVYDYGWVNGTCIDTGRCVPLE